MQGISPYSILQPLDSEVLDDFYVNYCTRTGLDFDFVHQGFRKEPRILLTKAPLLKVNLATLYGVNNRMMHMPKTSFIFATLRLVRRDVQDMHSSQRGMYTCS